jgi:hypothetical protein
MSQSDTLFPPKDPVYKPHLRQSGTITTFKAFEESLTELRFCKNKLTEIKEKEQHAIELAIEPFADEKALLKKQVEEIEGNVQLYLGQNFESIKPNLDTLQGVEIEEIHKFKIKSKKEKK